MTSLLRSVIEFDDIVSQEDLVRNFQHLRRAIDIGQFTWHRPEDAKIYKYIHSYFVQHFELPSAQTVLDEFKRNDDLEEIARVKGMASDSCYAKTNFVNLLRTIQEQQASERLQVYLDNAKKILTKGMVDKKTKEAKKGLNDAIEYLTGKAQDVRINDHQAQIVGDIRKDAAAMKEEYQQAEQDKGKVFGVLSGIEEMDEACKGAKKGELWIHAAFPGELKSTLACNWTYNAVTRYKKNVVYMSFEMPRHQIRRNIYVLHSTHPKFAKQGFKPLDYRAVRDGNLTKEEKEFYFDLVIPDFEECSNYTHFEVVTPDRGWNMGDIRSQLTLLQKEMDIGLVVFDHGQWIQAERRNKDYTIELNSIVNDSKQLALQFNGNEGLAVLMLFQINRTGKTEADKNDGVYKLNALTYANACEKSADIITASYLNNDLRRQGLSKFTNMKNRDNPPFDPFEVNIDWPAKKLHSKKKVEGFEFTEDGHDQYMGLMGI